MRLKNRSIRLRAVEHRAEARFPAAMDHRRDIGRSAGGFDLAAQLVRVIGLVGEHDGVLAQMAEQPRGHRAIASLAGTDPVRSLVRWLAWLDISHLRPKAMPRLNSVASPGCRFSVAI
jgi:hypothetical protein